MSEDKIRRISHKKDEPRRTLFRKRTPELRQDAAQYRDRSDRTECGDHSVQPVENGSQDRRKHVGIIRPEISADQGQDPVFHVSLTENLFLLFGKRVEIILQSFHVQLFQQIADIVPHLLFRRNAALRFFGMRRRG